MATAARLYFDFVDPLSYQVELALLELEADGDADVERIGYELRPPPAPLTLSSDPFWSARWETARRSSGVSPPSPAALVPWTRKAHELQVLACGRGVATDVRARLFRAYLHEGRDIGRIDELVTIAVAAGLDRTEAKAVLDVDKHEADVLMARSLAAEHGIADVPSLLVEGRLVEGFRNLADLSTLLGGPLRGGR